MQGPVRVGIEASGQSQWFERLLAELGHELWTGDAAKIRASCERKQKTDRRNALLLLQLLMEGRFPRIWVPTLGVDSRRAFQRRAPTAVGTHQQAGQYFSARVAGGSSAERGAA
ncbi:hypothetical protein AUG19_03190 [archaeon 13_1_20CM_2_54_9]|nr:MAG: hypothetical protein AUG19_03190 [archaeon 13_1_20CM_2_54_9]